MTIMVWGSHGHLLIDPETGDVLEVRHEEEGDTEYSDIVKFNLDERRAWYLANGIALTDPQPDGDILDFGFWTSSGEYCEPIADYRKEIMLAKYPATDA